MRNALLIKFVSAFLIIFIIDQGLKLIFLNGFRFESECISLVLAFNRGVAFSMLAFLDEYLKFLQLIIIIFALIYIFYEKKLFSLYSISLGMIFGAGFSNLFDRFIREGVVDYVYWHCYFEFAIFNFADVTINFAIGIILYYTFKNRHNESK